MSDVILDTLLDTLKLIPFLFLTYLLMEYIEHKTGEKAELAIKRAGKFGPVIGGLLGIVPQCGFSASAASLYSGRIISLGTLIAVFLSTSDEMLPICISEKVKPRVIIEIIAIKAVVAIIIGLSVDIIAKITHRKQRAVDIHCICENDNCHCEEGGIFKSALIHTGQISLFLLIITFALNLLIFLIGENSLSKIFVDIPIVGCAASALVGLIPNCAASVVITELFLKGIISTGSMIAGLLSSCGLGLLVLFRTNKKNLKENLLITLLLFSIGVIIGSIVDLIGVTI